MHISILVCDVGNTHEQVAFGKEYGVDNKTTPVVVIRPSNGEKYYLKDNVNIKNIKKFYK